MWSAAHAHAGGTGTAATGEVLAENTRRNHAENQISEGEAIISAHEYLGRRRT